MRVLRRRGSRGATVVEVLSEATTSIADRLGRSLMAAIGTTVGVAILIVVIGFGQTAESQIDSRFTQLAATSVTGRPTLAEEPDVFPDDTDQRVARIKGVKAAGFFHTVVTGNAIKVASSLSDDLGTSSRTVPVFAASPGLFDAAAVTGLTGRTFDSWHDGHKARVAVLSKTTARALGITEVAGQRGVVIEGIVFLVIGIAAEFPRSTEMEIGVVIPNRTARELFGPPDSSAEPTLLVRTRLGAAEVVAKQLAVAIRPDRPDVIGITPPVTPRKLADEVQGDLGSVFLGLGLVALVIGVIGIANSTTISVLERRGEIGLRVALGAKRSQIIAQFMFEPLLVGLLGGLTAAGLGSMVLVGIAASRDWTPVLDVRVVLAAPPLGASIGILAGSVPAFRAASVDPATSLRGGV